MKTILILMLFILPLQQSSALNIVQINISNISDNAINVSLNTEAVELYYFQSWQYYVIGTTIVLEACFVPGFGSTIAYLNNNFEIPLDSHEPATYHLIVKVYYTFYQRDCMQDMCEGMFSTPIKTKILAMVEIEVQEVRDMLFTNPSDGKLWVSPEITFVRVFDMTRRTVQNLNNCNGEIFLYDLADGMYYISYLKHGQSKTIRIILKKQ